MKRNTLILIAVLTLGACTKDVDPPGPPAAYKCSCYWGRVALPDTGKVFYYTGITSDSAEYNCDSISRWLAGQPGVKAKSSGCQLYWEN